MQCHDCAVNDEQEQQPSASVGRATPTPESWSMFRGAGEESQYQKKE